MASTEQFVTLIGLDLIALLTLFMPWIIKNHRRERWSKVSAFIDAAYYEVHGENVSALIDVSWDDDGHRQVIKRLPTGLLDIEKTPPGNVIEILVNPARRDRGVIYM